MENNSLSFALMNASSDLAAIIDTQGTVLEINEAAERRFNLDKSEILHKSIFELLPSDFSDFRKVYLDIVMQSREPHRFEDEYNGFSYDACIYPILDGNGDVAQLAIFASDKTVLKQNETLLYRYTKLLSTVQSPMFYLDKGMIFQTVNEIFYAYFKRNRGEVVGKHIKDIFGEEVFNNKLAPFLKECLDSKIVHNQEWFDFPDGSRRYMYMSYYPLLKDNNTLIGIVVNSVDITKNKQMSDELKKLTITDQLTGIYNRLKFQESLSDEINRLKRYLGKLSLIMFDIDHFKKINDTYGHDVGDEVLIQLSALVTKCIRDTDIFSRWGGEEFMILLPHTQLSDASKLAERIRMKVENKYFKGPQTVTCSFGVTSFLDSDSEESFTKRTDTALYQSKSSGRNRVTVL